MKLIVKRMYCPTCLKLIRARDEKAGSEIQVICTQCGTILYSWNGIRWKRTPKESNKQMEVKISAPVSPRKATADNKAK